MKDIFTVVLSSIESLYLPSQVAAKIKSVILDGNLGEEMDVKSIQKRNGVKQTEITMAQTGKKYGANLSIGLISKKELLWFVLNVDVVGLKRKYTVRHC